MAAGMAGALLMGNVAQAQDFSGASFEINRDRVRYGTIGTCAKSAAFLVPDVYLYITARTGIRAGGGMNSANAKARVFITGPGKTELQKLARQIQDDIIGALRGAGYTVLTFDDVRSDVADKDRWQPNPHYGMPTHDARAFPGTDFVVATPSDEQALVYGMSGPAGNFGKAAQRTGATLLLPEIYMTLPQLGASASKTFNGTSARISFDPAMHLGAINVYGATAKGGWCSILVPEHGGRLPAPYVGDFQELRVNEEEYSEGWGMKRGDFAFVVDDAAFQTGIRATSRSLARLIVDALKGKK